jgi:hypothetical protein
MSVSNDSYDNVTALGRKLYGVKIAFKNESKLMRLLSFLLFFNKDFMTRYITVIGKTVYFPSRNWLGKNRDAAAQALCHEFVHISDEQNVGSLVFRLSYLFPQCMAVFALAGFFVGPQALLFLLFLLPLPAPFRTFWELRGYAMTDAVLYSKYRQFSSTDFLVRQFTTSKYYYMWPFKKSLAREITKNRDAIRDERLHEKIIDANEILSSIHEKSEE